MARNRNSTEPTPLLPYGALSNSDFLSNHWLEHRLPLEPEWTELRAEANAALTRALDL